MFQSSLPFLASTIHDENGGLSPLFDKHLPLLLKQVSRVLLVATPATSQPLLKKIEARGCHVLQLKRDKPGSGYRTAIREGVKQSEDSPILCCDIDRVLHWMETYPKEWERMVKAVSKNEYTIYERTPRAYRTHHEALYETEHIANAITSCALGERNIHDYYATGMSFSSRVAKKLAASKVLSADWRILSEIPLFLQSQKIHPTYRACEGLEWETPDRFQDAIQKAGGLDTWREQLSTPTEWRNRTRIASVLSQPGLKKLQPGKNERRSK